MTNNHFRNIISGGVEIPVYSYENCPVGSENTYLKEEIDSRYKMEKLDQYDNDIDIHNKE